MNCTWHLCQTKLTGKQIKFCSSKCKNKFNVTKRRKAVKLKAIKYKGGSCEKCGYNKCIDALAFHHKGDKDFGISQYGHSRSWERVRNEIEKCQLLCANCHAEMHAKEYEATYSDR